MIDLLFPIHEFSSQPYYLNMHEKTFDDFTEKKFYNNCLLYIVNNLNCNYHQH